MTFLMFESKKLDSIDISSEIWFVILLVSFIFRDTIKDLDLCRAYLEKYEKWVKKIDEN